MINDKSEHVYFQSTRTDMLEFLPSEYSKILDVGCCNGNFKQLLNKPSEYWGVEPFEKSAEVAKTKIDKVLIGLYDEVADEIPDNYFDLIIAFDVIEHMEQPWIFLQSIKKKMAKNASIMLSIPNVRWIDNLKELLYKKDWKYKDEGILDITHLRFFTEKSIVRLLNENGFEIEKMKGTNSAKVRKWKLPLYYLLKFIFGSDIGFIHFGVRAKLNLKS